MVLSFQVEDSEEEEEFLISQVAFPAFTAGKMDSAESARLGSPSSKPVTIVSEFIEHP